MPNTVTFTEENIQKLFGHEAAENEDPVRLREYYFKGATYDQVAADLPLRILVGHKGIGKSALFKVAMAEDTDAKRLSVLIQPNDIVDFGTDTTDFLRTIRQWTDGLQAIISQKALEALGISAGSMGKAVSVSGKIIDFVIETVKNLQPVNFQPARQAIFSTFLKSNRITVYIDDLDRGWRGRPEDVARISALLNAVRDISSDNPGISFRIALRSDVYYLVRTSDESTDKVEGSVVWHVWTNHEIFVLLVKRIETFFGRTINEQYLMNSHQRDLAKYLLPIMEDRFRGKGHWEHAPMYRVLMSLIRKRPRDLVKLCSLAARHTHMRKGTLVTTDDFDAIFEEYSQGRIQDTINEFRSELPAIQKLIMNMKPNKRERTAKQGYLYATNALLAKIENIMQQEQFKFATGDLADKAELAAFLYKINFLTARKQTEAGIVRKYFEENRYLSYQFADFGFDWEIHPAYRWALQPDSPEDVFRTLALTADTQ